MAALSRFTITPDDGEPVNITASKLDAIVVERALGQPIITRAQEGFFEPLLRLAYQAAQRQKALPDGTSFDEFVDKYDIAMLTDDDEAAQGND